MNSHILTLQRMLEGVRAKQLPAVIIFIDFKKPLTVFIEAPR